MAEATSGEYDQRLRRVRREMAVRSYAALVVTDPANLYYLTGYDAWSFYTPQCLVVPASGDPVLFARQMDAAGAGYTACLSADLVEGYPEALVHRPDVHPYEWIADRIRARELVDVSDGPLVGVEADAHFFSARGYLALCDGLRGARLEDSRELVNWVRLVKSDHELDLMRAAGQVAQHAMEVALEAIVPGRRQCDAVADVMAAQASGTGEIGGDYPAIVPMLPTGDGAGTPHLTWTEAPFKSGEATTIEIAGAYRRYHAPIARTIMLGEPPARLSAIVPVVAEGMDALLDGIRPGRTPDELNEVWEALIGAHGLSKASRIGYSIGIGYPPDWGERTVSLRAGESTPLAAGMCFHVILGMWMDGWGYELSEPVVVTDDGVERLTDLTHDLTICPSVPRLPAHVPRLPAHVPRLPAHVPRLPAHVPRLPAHKEEGTPMPPASPKLAARAEGLVGSVIDSSTSLLQKQSHDIVRFAMGSPAAEAIPTKLLADIGAAAIGPDAADAFDYAATEGDPVLRTQVLEMLSGTGEATESERLTITSGGMQGIDLACKLYVDPGDLVVVESPTYTNGSATVMSYGGEVLEAPVDGDGMVVESLPDLVSRAGRTPTAIYTIPNFQNPSGVTLSLERRRRLLELAREWGAVVIDDDPYGLLRFEGDEIPSLRELGGGDPTVFSVRTFSKILAPGLRVGWVDAAPDLADLLINAKQAMDTCTNLPAQRLVAGFLAEGHLEEHVRALRGEYHRRKVAMQQALAEHFGEDATWTDPSGGFFLWVTLDDQSVDAQRLFEVGLAEGVAFIPGPAFSPGGSFRNAFRLCFASTAPERTAVGIARLRTAYDRVRDETR